MGVVVHSLDDCEVLAGLYKDYVDDDHNQIVDKLDQGNQLPVALDSLQLLALDKHLMVVLGNWLLPELGMLAFDCHYLALDNLIINSKELLILHPSYILFKVQEMMVVMKVA